MEKKKSCTKPTLYKDQKGSLSFLGLTVFLCLFAAFLLYFTFQLQEISQTRTHTRSLLCLKNFVVKSNKYLEKMEFLNKTIQASHLASLIPATRPAAQATKKASQVAQQLLHVAYMKKIQFNYPCQLQNRIQFIKTTLVKTSGRIILKRKHPSGTTIRNLKWKIKFIILHRKQILDILDLQMDHSQIKVNRVQNPGSVIWNSSFGFQP
jgi:hypothetical protein